MGRRSNTPGLIEMLLDLATLAPRVGAAIGVLFCLGAAGLYWITPRLPLAPLFALILGFVGIACLGAAAIGWVQWHGTISSGTDGRRKITSGPVHRRVQSGGIQDLDSIRALTWQQFERFVADLFRRQGFVVRETGQEASIAGHGDGGVDLIVTDPRSPGTEYLVQCKQYKAWDVGEPKVREFFGAMAAWHTRCEGIVVTCGRFTQPAQRFAEDKPIRLIDGDGLLKLLHTTNTLTPVAATPAPSNVQAASLPSAPRCPQCGTTMVRRTARRGIRRGQAFWGCPTYPKCNACINIDS